MTLTNPPTMPVSGTIINVNGAGPTPAFGKPVVDSINELDTRTSDASTGNTQLGTRVGALETTVNATGTTAAGNAALSSRLGTGVTTASTATAQLALKAPTSRQILAGTGLSGGGDFSADRTLSVSYGTAAGTAAQGNDTRITITQDATKGNVALDSRVATLEAGSVAPTGIGDWTKTAPQTLTGASANDKLLFQQVNVTAVGITKTDTTYSKFTITQAGLWLFTLDVRFAGTLTTDKYVMIGDDTGVFYAKTSNTSSYNSGATTTSSSALNLSVTCIRQCATSDLIVPWAYAGNTGATVVQEGTTKISRFTATRIR